MRQVKLTLTLHCVLQLSSTALARSECELELDQYSSLSQFFTRRLKPNLRPISEGSLVVSPADGTITNSAPLKVGITSPSPLQS